MFNAGPDALMDRALTRNAQLRLMLRQVVKAFHQSTTLGHGRDSWSHCAHPTCKAVNALLDTQEESS